MRVKGCEWITRAVFHCTLVEAAIRFQCYSFSACCHSSLPDPFETQSPSPTPLPLPPNSLFLPHLLSTTSRPSPAWFPSLFETEIRFQKTLSSTWQSTPVSRVSGSSFYILRSSKQQLVRLLGLSTIDISGFLRSFTQYFSLRKVPHVYLHGKRLLKLNQALPAHR